MRICSPRSSQGSVPSPVLTLPFSRGPSYCSVERPWLRSALLQLLLDSCGKNGDSVERDEGGVGGWRTQRGGAPPSSGIS